MAFGGRAASSFEITSDSIIKAVIGKYGGTGAISITNHKGTMTKDGFLYIPEVIVENPNLALNKSATASASFNSEGLAIDGDLSTRWSTINEDNQWYQVDLMKIYSINTVRIMWEGAYASEYDLMVSTDDITFTPVYSTTEGVGGNDSIVFPNIEARYVKIMLNKRGTPWSMSFWEFEVYNTPPPVNLALNKLATTSADINSPSLGLDGDLSTRWSTINEDGQWFNVDLGKEYEISKIKIFWEGAYASEYDLQVSTDDIVFSSVFSATNGEGGEVEHTFAKAAARYVKIMLNKRGTPWAISFWEFEVYE